MEREESEREHHVFWMLTKGCRDRPVGRVYLAIQAALAYGQERVEVGWLMGALMARGQWTAGPDYAPVGAEGLAYFHWLYEVELLEAGEADAHDYRFRRRHDGRQIVVRLRTAANPRGLHFQQAYARQKRALEKQRERFLTVRRQRPERPAENDLSDD